MPMKCNLFKEKIEMLKQANFSETICSLETEFR